MGYDDFTRDFQSNDAFIKNQSESKQDLYEHKLSKECTGKPDCPICIKLREEIIANNPTLP